MLSLQLDPDQVFNLDGMEQEDILAMTEVLAMLDFSAEAVEAAKKKKRKKKSVKYEYDPKLDAVVAKKKHKRNEDDWDSMDDLDW